MHIRHPKQLVSKQSCSNIHQNIDVYKTTPQPPVSGKFTCILQHCSQQVSCSWQRSTDQQDRGHRWPRHCWGSSSRLHTLCTLWCRWGCTPPPDSQWGLWLGLDTAGLGADRWWCLSNTYRLLSLYNYHPGEIGGGVWVIHTDCCRCITTILGR